MRGERNLLQAYLLVSGILIALSILNVVIGAVDIPFPVVGSLFAGRELKEYASFATILFDIRLPHAALIALAGAALGGSGAAYQGLFRNPLADPYLIGVASGAGLGTVIAVNMALPAGMMGSFGIPLAAFFGAIATIGLVYLIARSPESTATTGLILAGVALSSFATALTTYILLTSSGELRGTLAWLAGGSTSSGWTPVYASLPYIAVGLCILFYQAHHLNALQFGDQQAKQLGLDVAAVKRNIVLGSTLASAAAVAFAGIIGFVGLIMPHAIRGIWGPDHRHLIPLSVLSGASFLLLADTLARSIIAPQTLPLGIITALFGAPFFVWVLRRYRTRGLW